MQVNSRARHAVMGGDEPGTEDGLGENIENSVGDDLSIKTDLASTVGDTPDARTLLARRHVERHGRRTLGR